MTNEDRQPTNYESYTRNCQNVIKTKKKVNLTH